MTGMPARQRTPELFKGLHFDHEGVILCVRWYLSYKLSSRDLVNMMGERSVELAHTTILRWVQRYVPEFEKRWNRYARTVGGSWRCDETYIKVKGRWTYLYRAVDKQGRTVDFLLSAKRAAAAAKPFLQQAMQGNGTPRGITLDAYAASDRAVRELKAAGAIPKRVRVRSCKYLNNGIEQDHRRVKQRIGPRLGFKRFDSAAVTISGIELAAKNQEGTIQGRKVAGPADDRARNLDRCGGRLIPNRHTVEVSWANLKFAPEPYQRWHRNTNPLLRVHIPRGGRAPRCCTFPAQGPQQLCLPRHFVCFPEGSL